LTIAPRAEPRAISGGSFQNAVAATTRSSRVRRFQIRTAVVSKLTIPLVPKAASIL
jgi:hypothetical protein